jgi:hypothetical protein
MRTVVRRPRPQPDEIGRRADDELRRTSARAITAAVGVLVALPLAGTAFFAGHGLTTVGCGSTVMRVLGIGALVVAACAMAATAAFGAALVLPATRDRTEVGRAA